MKGTVKTLLWRCYEHHILKSAAALAYYMLFALFPLLIFASNLLGLLELDITAVTDTLTQVVPHEVVVLTETYLEYTNNNANHPLLWISLLFSVWFTARAARGLMTDVRRAYELGRPRHPLRYIVKQYTFTLLLLAVLAVALPLTVLGENVVALLAEPLAIQLPSIWQYLRFVPVGALMLAAIGGLYALALEGRHSIKTLLPGMSVALIGWFIISIGFSIYVENFARYSLLYGAMGAVMVLLVWLYLTAVMLIAGAEYNAVREKGTEP